MSADDEHDDALDAADTIAIPAANDAADDESTTYHTCPDEGTVTDRTNVTTNTTSTGSTSSSSRHSAGTGGSDDTKEDAKVDAFKMVSASGPTDIEDGRRGDKEEGQASAPSSSSSAAGAAKASSVTAASSPQPQPSARSFLKGNPKGGSSHVAPPGQNDTSYVDVANRIEGARDIAATHAGNSIDADPEENDDPAPGVPLPSIASMPTSSPQQIQQSGFEPQQARSSSHPGPGAFFVTPRSRSPNADNADSDGSGRNGDASANLTADGHLGSVAGVDFHSVSAYVVEETPAQDEESTTTAMVFHEAKVVPTICGVDRKRFLIMIGAVVVLLGVVLGAVLGTLLPNSTNASASNVNACGPLCPDGQGIADSGRVVMGRSCEEWVGWSSERPVPAAMSPEGEEGEVEDYCRATYEKAAYGCGCALEPPLDGCGLLCLGPDESIPDPEKIVTDINNVRMACKDWEIEARFDTNPDECVNYNAVGVLCGCQSNVPPPDACGPLCGDDTSENAEDFFQTYNDYGNKYITVYDQLCEEWGVFSKYLPESYGDHGETCHERYRDIARRCECPGAELPPAVCNSLCQERSNCGTLCADGSPVPDPDLVVRDMSCLRWEFRSRMDSWEGQEELCNFHNMVGAECGCIGNEPPENACGPLCGPDSILPDPERSIEGYTCAEWDSLSTYLYEGYGLAMGAGSSTIPSCDEFRSLKAYGCGCPSAPEPPLDACGALCRDGSSVPFPELVVGDRTCADLDLASRFETEPDRCNFLRNFIGPQCGCEEDADVDENKNRCYTIQDIESSNEIYPYFIGQNAYFVSFGDGGQFVQIQNSMFVIPIGDYFGFDTNATSNSAHYGGGAPCGLHGPRRGKVVLVEDPSATVPFISDVIEPTVCYYQVEMKVPEVCQ